jgi:hypothetical protein
MLLGLGALLLGILSIFAEPCWLFIIEKCDDFGIGTPSFLISPPQVHDPNQNVTYIGRNLQGIEHFQNIFYGEDTSGENRFAPPTPVRHAPGSVVDASQAGAWCPQGTGDILPFTSKIVNISENCLSLRIARSRGTKSDAKLPVMVWIHGGMHLL